MHGDLLPLLRCTISKSVIRAGLDFGGGIDTVGSTLGGYQANKFKYTEGGRISSEDVFAMEKSLDAEYVPFYFHDLRTNEIVSFHAFLSSLNDSFNANYESVDAYGRVEPVRIYRSTERSIDLSFHVAATSEDDFDEMWWKVNKLITLLYPQWSPGRQKVGAGGEKFRQPFSQIPTASPLIRLRVGDVIKSNYSKFNLARLFGLGREDFSAGEGFNVLDPSGVENAIDVAKSFIADIMSDPDISDDQDKGFQKGQIAILRPTRGGYYLQADPTGNALQQAASILAGGSARKKIRLPVECKVRIADIQKKQIDRTKLNFGPGAQASKTTYTVEFADPKPPEIEAIIAAGVENLEVTHTDLKIDPDYIVSLSGFLTELTNQSVQNQDSVSAFMNSNDNVIVKAFESARGKGLAGVITNMTFDWYTPTWDTERLGARAPQWCEIKISFAPVHDIAPGLDSDGFNRAPVYNVGSIVNRIMGDVYDSAEPEDTTVSNAFLELRLALLRMLSQLEDTD